jgi:hypothetical protein
MLPAPVTTSSGVPLNVQVTLIDQSPQQLAKARAKPALKGVTIMEASLVVMLCQWFYQLIASRKLPDVPDGLRVPLLCTRRVTPRTCPSPQTPSTATSAPAASSTGLVRL